MPIRWTATSSTPAAASSSRTAAPNPPASTFSSTVKMRGTRRAHSSSKSTSRGFTKRGFTTAQEMPSASSRSAASTAICTDLPSPKMTTSLPSRDGGSLAQRQLA